MRRASPIQHGHSRQQCSIQMQSCGNLGDVAHERSPCAGLRQHSMGICGGSAAIRCGAVGAWATRHMSGLNVQGVANTAWACAAAVQQSDAELIKGSKAHERSQCAGLRQHSMGICGGSAAFRCGAVGAWAARHMSGLNVQGLAHTAWASAAAGQHTDAELLALGGPGT